MIKPWLFEFFVAPGPPGVDVTPQAATEHYTWYLDLWQKLEGWGFEGIFFSEHHFGAAYSPSPNLIIATMAPRTRTWPMPSSTVLKCARGARSPDAPTEPCAGMTG